MSIQPSTGEVQPFADWLNLHRSGFCHHELSAAMAQLAAAVTDTGLVGELTLKVKIKPLLTGGNCNQLVVSDEVTTKIPKRPSEPSIWFFAEENPGLQREDPRQIALALDGLREVQQPAARDLPSTTD